MSQQDLTRRLVLAIVDFIRGELATRLDLSVEDRESLAIAAECLEMTYGLENAVPMQHRSLMDMFNQVANPVPVNNRIQAETLKESANNHMQQEEYQQAEETYTQAIELDPWNSVYYCNRAGARTKLERYFDAIQDCRQAQVLSPDYAKAYSRMGQAYALADRHSRAARCFQQALIRDPGNEQYQRNLEAAQTRAAQATEASMGNFLQTIMQALMGMPGPGATSGPGASEQDQHQRQHHPPAFFIVSEPHSESECDSRHCPHAEESANEDNSNADNGDENDGDDDNEMYHVRVLVGIPSVPEEGANPFGQGLDEQAQRASSDPGPDAENNQTSGSPQSSSGRPRDPFEEIFAALLRNAQIREHAQNQEQQQQNRDAENTSQPEQTTQQQNGSDSSSDQRPAEADLNSSTVSSNADEGRWSSASRNDENEQTQNDPNIDGEQESSGENDDIEQGMDNIDEKTSSADNDDEQRTSSVNNEERQGTSSVNDDDGQGSSADNFNDEEKQTNGGSNKVGSFFKKIFKKEEKKNGKKDDA